MTNGFEGIDETKNGRRDIRNLQIETRHLFSDQQIPRHSDMYDKRVFGCYGSTKRSPGPAQI